MPIIIWTPYFIGVGDRTSRKSKEGVGSEFCHMIGWDPKVGGWILIGGINIEQYFANDLEITIPWAET